MSPGIGRAAVLVGVGGVAGTLARYEVSLLLPEAHGWPLATLAVNVSGAFLLGLLLELLARAGTSSAGHRSVRPLLGTGFLGSFTTYSSFAVEVERLLATGSGGIAAGYVAVSLAAGLAACIAGMVAGSLGPRRRTRRRERTAARR